MAHWTDEEFKNRYKGPKGYKGAKGSMGSPGTYFGYDTGFAVGKSDGYTTGYNAGVADCLGEDY